MTTPTSQPTATAAGQEIDLLIRCLDYLGKEIQRLSLNESAASGVQKLSRDIAEYLDAPSAPTVQPTDALREKT